MRYPTCSISYFEKIKSELSEETCERYLKNLYTVDLKYNHWSSAVAVVLFDGDKLTVYKNIRVKPVYSTLNIRTSHGNKTIAVVNRYVLAIVN